MDWNSPLLVLASARQTRRHRPRLPSLLPPRVLIPARTNHQSRTSLAPFHPSISHHHLPCPPPPFSHTAPGPELRTHRPLRHSPGRPLVSGSSPWRPLPPSPSYSTSDLRLRAVVFSPSSASALFTAGARRQPPTTPSSAVSVSASPRAAHPRPSPAPRPTRRPPRPRSTRLRPGRRPLPPPPRCST